MTYLLPEFPDLTPAQRRQIQADYAADSLPPELSCHLADVYGLDITGEYGGRRIKNPFGKASGQLSLAAGQVRADAEAGLGFVVLKTVIAEDESGEQAMADWAFKESRMQLEPIAGKTVGRLGWTVTWKGRGWHDTFEAYRQLYTDSLAIGNQHGMVVASSVKYHLPGPGETVWREGEYAYTTARLLEVWRESGVGGPMVLEKDFSPTLAGDSRSRQQAIILEWMSTVPRLIRAAAGTEGVTLGLKVMNAMFDDSFQLDLLKAAVAARPDFLIYANRLFDPGKEFEGKVGVAYGGPDLSHRNLRMLTLLGEAVSRGEVTGGVPPISGTGDVCSGKMAAEYALRGASSVQMHTLFQLPDIFFGLRSGSKSQKALHYLLFDPATGLIPWMLHVKARTGVNAWLNLSEAAGLPELGA